MYDLAFIETAMNVLTFIAGMLLGIILTVILELVFLAVILNNDRRVEAYFEHHDSAEL